MKTVKHHKKIGKESHKICWSWFLFGLCYDVRFNETKQNQAQHNPWHIYNHSSSRIIVIICFVVSCSNLCAILLKSLAVRFLLIMIWTNVYYPDDSWITQRKHRSLALHVKMDHSGADNMQLGKSTGQLYFSFIWNISINAKLEVTHIVLLLIDYHLSRVSWK